MVIKWRIETAQGCLEALTPHELKQVGERKKVKKEATSMPANWHRGETSWAHSSTYLFLLKGQLELKSLSLLP